MKRVIISVLVAAVILLSLPVTLLVVGFGLPSAYDATYYGQLAPQCEKLQNAEGKKIVIIGTSGVAFGVDSALIESELGYEVCNFGLYGALGTKLMLDLSLDEIGAGDIVVFTPEPGAQTLSLYFSARETWRALDGHTGLLGRLPDDNRKSMTGAFAEFAGEKFSYLTGEPAAGSGVYARSSFDANGDLKNYPRPYNIMADGYDPDSTIELTEDLFGAGFADYVNDYYAEVKARGAQMYYSFAPMNGSAMTGDEDAIDNFADSVLELFSFDIMGDPRAAVMASGWFYDSNFHLNEAGMRVNTVRLIRDLKTRLGITTDTDIELPEMPSAPADEPSGEGDNTDADCFVYGQVDEKVVIIGLTEKGRARAQLTVPFSHNGKVVSSFTADTFAGDTAITEIKLQNNITRLRDGSFDGCTALRKIVLEHRVPASIGVGFGLLTGTQNCYIYVPRGTLSVFNGDYFWGHYVGSIKEI